MTTKAAFKAMYKAIGFSDDAATDLTNTEVVDSMPKLSRITSETAEKGIGHYVYAITNKVMAVDCCVCGPLFWSTVLCVYGPLFWAIVSMLSDPL